jgi:transcription initiation factor IIE alpha subunit
VERDIQEVIHAIARLYLYPSYADVELDPRFERLVKRARNVLAPLTDNVIILDGKEYRYGIEDDVTWTYYDEPLTRSAERQLIREVNSLYRKFKKLIKTDKESYYAFLENSNPDGYIASLIYITKE